MDKIARAIRLALLIQLIDIGSMVGLAGADECGFKIAAAPGSRDGVSIIRFGNGGQLVAWRDNRLFDGGQPFLSFVDSLGGVSSAWPANGLQLTPAGTQPIAPMMTALAPTSAVIVWSDFGGAGTGYDPRIAFLTTQPGVPPQPAGVTVDTVTDRARSQVAVGLVRQDDTHGLVIMKDDSVRSRILIKPFTAPGGTPNSWPPVGILLADAAGVFPRGLAPVSSCSDDSSGCYVLGAGTVPIDDFHFTVTFLLFRLLPNGVLDPRWPITGLSLTQDGDEFNQVNELVPDGRGGIYTGWTTGNHSASGQVRVIAQHVDRSGSIHPGWESQGKLAMPSTSAVFQWLPRLEPLGQLGLALVIESDNGPMRVRAFQDDGVPYFGWPDSGLAIGLAPGASLVSGSERIEVVDGTEVVVAWSATRPSAGGHAGILGLGLDLQGNMVPGWPASGAPLCADTSSDEIEALGIDVPHTFAVASIRGPSDLRFARFSVQDGSVPVGPEARLLSYSVTAGRLRSLWAISAREAADPVGLIQIGDAVIPRGTVARLGRDLCSLSDTIPSGTGTVGYMLGVLSGGRTSVISDILTLRLDSSAPGLTIELERFQTGRVLAVDLELDRSAEAVELRVFDPSGRCLGTKRLGSLPRGRQRVELTLSCASQGMVFVRATSRSNSAVARTTMLN